MAQVLSEKLEHTGPAEKERAAGKHVGAAFAKRKRNRVDSAKHQIVRGKRAKVSESRTLARTREIRARV